MPFFTLIMDTEAAIHPRIASHSENVAIERSSSRGNPRGKCRWLLSGWENREDCGKAAWRMPEAVSWTGGKFAPTVGIFMGSAGGWQRCVTVKAA